MQNLFKRSMLGGVCIGSSSRSPEGRRHRGRGKEGGMMDGSIEEKKKRRYTYEPPMRAL
jgi:hypothetical protein